ncbi:MAG: 4Fe-4S dicluster domain-containing protein [Pseudomonadota bacterium]
MSIFFALRPSDLEAFHKLQETSGQNLHRCMQCGQCSASCPMFATGESQASPRRVMHLLQLGLVEELARLNTPWVCASCHTCQARCPRSVDLPRVMEAVRLLTLRRNINFIEPAKIPAPIISRAPQIAMVSAFRKLTA